MLRFPWLPSQRPSRGSATGKRGSALLATLCFAGVLSLSVSGYLAICYRSMVVSNREINYSHSIELAEIGMDEALWALNNSTAFADGTWTLSGGNATKTLTDPDPSTPGPFKYDNGAHGQVTIKVTAYASTTPTIDAVGAMTLSDGTVITRGLGSAVLPAQLFTNAIGAIGSVTFNSGGVIDSYNSGSVYIPTDPAHLTSANSAAVVSATSVDLGNAQVYGFAATNGTTLQYLAGAKVNGPNTPPLTSIDPTLLSSNATQPLFDPATPVGPSDPVTLPATLTTSTTLTASGVYHLNSINLGDGAVLTIQVPVVLKVSDSVHTSGTGQIIVTSTGSLQLQVDENDGQGLDLQGGGIDNQTYLPEKLSILVGRGYSGDSTSTFNTTQNFYGTIYLPNDSISIAGYPSIFGALIAKTATFTGSPYFHYDTALQQASISGVSTPFALQQLRELTPTEIAAL